MENNILIKREELQQEVDLKTYYMGEAIKRKDIDADTIQSSTDEEELFGMFLQKAVNELATSVAMRFDSVKFDVTDNYVSISFTHNGKTNIEVTSILRQRIKDYLVNKIIYSWLNLRQTVSTAEYYQIHNIELSKVKDIFAIFYNKNKVRRRSTDLAGI